MKSILALFFALAAAPAAKADPVNLPDNIKTAFSKAGLPLQREKRRPRPFTLTALDGASVSLDSLKGKVVFLNFWATWCPPCREEMPSMEALYQKFRSKGLEIVACDIMENKERVEKFMRDKNINFQALLDSDGRVSRTYGVQGIPVTFILDRDGMIILSAVGGRDWNSPPISAAFEALLSYGQ
ncbi:MAG: TlpA family protein disulfide reductase [Spirochaetaceae bacterium]|nr:TlpA family protein disulfide reductase [Spirochaetaceae bacterium]